MRSLRRAVRDLDPGCFAVVMATGIVSQAMRLDGAGALSAALLVTAIAAYAVLVAASVWRLVAYRAGFLADASDPGCSFAFYTFVAASSVLAAGLAADGPVPLAAALLAAAAGAWLLLTYAIPVALAGWHRPPPALARANGTWFLCAVGTQSLAVAVTVMPASAAAPAEALAVACWSVGVVLYLLIASLVTTSLLRYPRRPADVTPAYWIFMGASAISVLAGSQILGLPPHPVTASVHGLVAGVSVVLWAFGTWLIPLLLAVGAWRHLLHRVPLRYEAGWWSIVFPLGMHAVASLELGRALRVPWLVSWGDAEGWSALAAWLAVSLALAGAAVSRRTAHRNR
jgi:tellurite resistance protein TehA-like permease